MHADCDVAVLGAGPYGLAVASHLRRSGVDVHVFGHPMSFWRERMPVGMLLRSNWGATNIADLHGDLTLGAYQADTGALFSTPVPLSDFVDYGLWFQRHAVADLDTRLVDRVERSGARLSSSFSTTWSPCRRAGSSSRPESAPLPALPPALTSLPARLVSHASAHRDLGTFAGKRVLVLGGGQSALESAALLHEAGAVVEVLVRSPHVIWLRGGTIHERLGRATPIFYGPTDVGPLGISRLLAYVGPSAPLATSRLDAARTARDSTRAVLVGSSTASPTSRSPWAATL